MRGKASDRCALWAHQHRLNPPSHHRYQITIYSMRIPVSDEVGSILRREGRGGIPNRSNLWYASNGKDGRMRRRYTPYRDLP